MSFKKQFIDDENPVDSSDFEKLLQESFEKEKATKREAAEKNAAVEAVAPTAPVQVGDRINGKVTRIESFGAFVELSPGVEGLLHISEMSWARIKSPADVVKVGQALSVTVLKVEAMERKWKISLSIKNKSEDPWLNLPAPVAVGALVPGRITRCMPFGAFVEIAPGVEGLIPLSELSAKRIVKAEDVVKPGETVTVLVKEIQANSKRMSLSLKGAAQMSESLSEQANLAEYQSAQKSKTSSAALGDLGAKLQAALTSKKSN